MTKRICFASLFVVILFAFAVGCGDNKQAAVPTEPKLSQSEAQLLESTYGLCCSIVDNTTILGNCLNGNVAGYTKLQFVIQDAQGWWLSWESTKCPSERMRHLWMNCKKLSKDWSLYTFSVGQYLLGRTTIEDLFARMQAVNDSLSAIQTEIERNGAKWGIPEGSSSITI